MHVSARTDLASEARELWEQNPGQTTKLEGVEARDEDVSGFHGQQLEGHLQAAQLKVILFIYL